MAEWLVYLIGIGLGGILAWRVATRRAVLPFAKGSEAVPPTSDPPELGWVFRANGALGLWLRRERGTAAELTDPGLNPATERAIAERLGGLAGPGAGQSGVERLEEGNLVYVASEDVQVAVLLPAGRQTGTALRDLEQVVSIIRTREVLEVATGRTPSAGQSVVSIAVRLALEVERLCDAEAAVAVRRLRGAQVMGAALRADPHLHRAIAAPGSPVDMAVRGEVTGSALCYEPFGLLPWDRRQRERRAFVMPISGPGSGAMAALVIWTRDGNEPAGALRVELAKAVDRTGRLLEDGLQRLELAEQVTGDPLTGLRNRRGFEQAMGMAGVTSGAVIAVDLDHFKSLNDALGHPAGDSALGFVARILTETVRDSDTAARVGGEEFAVWLPGSGIEEASRVAERVRTRIAGRAWGWQGRPWPITASLGVAGWPGSTNSRDNLVALADEALYRAKNAGRNRVEVAENRTQDLGLRT
jgi:diguanylate cyclase (GGDEF)-like protein